jgi:peptidyl-prolyl cis-trans isomerase C
MSAASTVAAQAVPTVNGIAIAHPEEGPLPVAELRQRAGVELLRQAAIAEGLLGGDDPEPLAGAISEAAAQAIDALLEANRGASADDRSFDESACRRHHAANAMRFAHGERLCLRHILFAAPAGVPLAALRERAEACLLALRARSRDEIEAAPGAGDRFAAAARQFSNCPSGAAGGALGWVTAEDCAPEFARELFGQREHGVLPRLVATRHGLHVVEVLERIAGEVPPFEAVHEAVRASLLRQRETTALRCLLAGLAAQARIDGVVLEDFTAAQAA